MRCLTLLLALLAVGCGGDEASVEPGHAQRLVLQQADLPGFVAYSSAGDPDGWTVRFRRSGTATEGSDAVESSAEISDTGDRAQARMSEAREELDDSELDWQPIGEPGLGDESFASTVVRGTVRSYRVIWRDGNVTAHLSVGGPEGKLAFADALALAEKQERRIADAKT